MRDEDAVNLVLHELFEHGCLPRTSSLSHSNDDFYERLDELAGHKQLLHQLNEFIIPQPRGLALADPSVRGRIVAWVDGSRACLEKLQRDEPDREWRTSEIAGACGLTVLGASVSMLYRAVFLQGCRNVGEWSSETGFPERVSLAQSIRRPRETLADLIRRHSMLPGGVSAHTANREAASLANAITILDKLETLVRQGVDRPGSVAPHAISSLLADLPEVPAPRPSLEELRAASRDSTFAEYRRGLLRRRRSVSRHDIELLTECIEATLDDLHDLTGLRQKADGPVVSMKGPAWDRLAGFVQQLASALGTSAYFGDYLRRHLRFAQSVDYIAIVDTDWPESRKRIKALDYELVAAAPSPELSPKTSNSYRSDNPSNDASRSVAGSGTAAISSSTEAGPGAGNSGPTPSRPKPDGIVDHDQVLSTLREWARQVHKRGIAAAAYVFGSLVSEDDEFDLGSDIDLMLVFPAEASNALERANRLESLALLTSDLELRLMRALKKSDANEALVSINVVTEAEISLRIHKGGERSLYENLFGCGSSATPET